jgi:hypothetical protein
MYLPSLCIVTFFLLRYFASSHPRLRYRKEQTFLIDFRMPPSYTWQELHFEKEKFDVADVGYVITLTTMPLVSFCSAPLEDRPRP